MGQFPKYVSLIKQMTQISCDEKSGNWMDYLVPISAYGNLNHGGQRETIKSAIMQKGPLVSYVLS